MAEIFQSDLLGVTQQEFLPQQEFGGKPRACMAFMAVGAESETPFCGQVAKEQPSQPVGVGDGWTEVSRRCEEEILRRAVEL